MKTIIIVLFLTLLWGCAANDAVTMKDNSTPKDNTFPNIETTSYKQTAFTNQPKPQPNIEVREVVKVKEVMINDPNAVKIHNLYWRTSDNAKWISSDQKSKLFFDLGVCFQLGLADGFGSRKLTRDERLKMYPIFREYQEKNKIGFIDINVAYEGGYEEAVKFLEEQHTPVLAAPPQKQEQQKK